MCRCASSTRRRCSSRVGITALRSAPRGGAGSAAGRLEQLSRLRRLARTAPRRRVRGRSAASTFGTTKRVAGTPRPVLAAAAPSARARRRCRSRGSRRPARRASRPPRRRRAASRADEAVPAEPAALDRLEQERASHSRPPRRRRYAPSGVRRSVGHLEGPGHERRKRLLAEPGSSGDGLFGRAQRPRRLPPRSVRQAHQLRETEVMATG